MSWIDTPLVRENKADLATFREMIANLPGPLKKTTSVEKCGQILRQGHRGTQEPIYCPGWVGLTRWLRPADRHAARRAGHPQVHPRVCCPEWTQRPPRSAVDFSARTEELEKH